MTAEGLKKVRADFAAAALRARDGGGRDELGIHRMRRWIDELEAA